jgi:hypothetical protein
MLIFQVKLEFQMENVNRKPPAEGVLVEGNFEVQKLSKQRLAGL